MPKGFKTNVIPGEKYGELTVVKEIKPRISPSGNKVRRVLCTCSCDGKEVETDLSELRRGRKTSCGCVAESKKLRVFPGEVYGRLTVIEETEIIKKDGKKMRGVRCKCSCGNPEDVIVRLDGLIRGDYKSCGCYQKEILMTSGKKNKKYNTYDLSGEYGIGFTSKGESFLFDLNDYNLIKDYCWWVGGDGYVSSRKNSNDKIVKMHRLLMKSKKDEVVDHINRNRLDNRKENLRKCTLTENARNISIQKNNKSGITGVRFNKQLNKWTAEIKVNYKKICLGTFDTKEEAAKARYDAELLYFGTFSPNYEKLTQQQSIQNESSKPSEQQNTQ